MRKGIAKAMAWLSQPSAPAAFSTPRVECIITTMMMQSPLA